MRIKKSEIKKVIGRIVQEARYGGRQKDAARKWKQGDPLNLTYDDDDDDYFPEEIRDFMSPEEKEKFLDDDDDDVEAGGSTIYTLDDIVDTKVLKTRSPAGTKGWIDNTLDLLKRYLTDDEFADILIEIKEDQTTFDDFAEARDEAIKIWTASASKVLGQDVSKLPEFSDNMFMNGFLYDFWFMSVFIKPLIRQMDKGKDLKTSLRSVGSRWKYMTMPNRVSDFIKNVMTPVFTYLTRDTDVAG